MKHIELPEAVEKSKEHHVWDMAECCHLKFCTVVVAKSNKDKAAAWLTSHAGAVSSHQCAKYVREALEAGGLNTAARPMDAESYGPFLQMSGFSKVSMQGYFPQKGDVVVIQNYPGGNSSGHIAFYTGTQWVSDYRQMDMVPGSFYRNAGPPMQVYRP